ncbi:hypothetical protein Tco_0548722 [Tanacetum coccineum]
MATRVRSARRTVSNGDAADRSIIHLDTVRLSLHVTIAEDTAEQPVRDGQLSWRHMSSVHDLGQIQMHSDLIKQHTFKTVSKLHLVALDQTSYNSGPDLYYNVMQNVTSTEEHGRQSCNDLSGSNRLRDQDILPQIPKKEEDLEQTTKEKKDSSTESLGSTILSSSFRKKLEENCPKA